MNHLQGWVRNSSLGRGQGTSADVHVFQREWKSRKRDAMRLCGETPKQDLALCYMRHLLNVLAKYSLLLVLGTEC